MATPGGPIPYPRPLGRPSVPVRNPPSGAPSATVGLTILTAVLSSCLTSAITAFVLIHYAVIPVAVITPAVATVSSNSTTAKSAKGNAPATKTTVVTSGTAGPVTATSRTSATAALEILQLVGQDQSFVSPTVHNGLYSNLTALERAAAAVSNDDASDAAASARLNATFYRALDTAIARASSIGTRTSETQDARDVAQALAAKLGDLKPPGQ